MFSCKQGQTSGSNIAKKMLWWNVLITKMITKIIVPRIANGAACCRTEKARTPQKCRGECWEECRQKGECWGDCWEQCWEATFFGKKMASQHCSRQSPQHSPFSRHSSQHSPRHFWGILAFSVLQQAAPFAILGTIILVIIFVIRMVNP